MAMPVHKLTPEFEKQVLKALQECDVNFEEPRRLAGQVKQLSDFYLSAPGRATPWDEPFATPAYLAYFQPLNFVRLRAAFQEVKRFLPPDSFSQIWDFGSGLGTTQWVLESEPSLTPRPLFAIESSKHAMELHRKFASERALWQPQFVKSGKPAENALAVFSYSFLEMQNALPDLAGFTHLLIVEPSFRETGRDLMQWRSRLIGQGFNPLAPCTHAQECPLLTQSQRDWCHMRVHFSAPQWLERLENFLPMKNRTLTYSYLLMSRSVTDSVWRGAARAIGDTLEERGKTRQMVCRGPKREFLSWLHKHGEAPEIPHGALVRGSENAIEKGGELRAAPGSLTWEI
jgi:ribosomal protein RSM22 (predicted rRNA methylase)